MNRVGRPEPPEVREVEALGLPTSGTMAEEPSMAVSVVMAIVSFLAIQAAGTLGWEIPPELRVYADDWGWALAGAAVAGWQLVQGRLIRGRVAAPVTVLKLLMQARRSAAQPPRPVDPIVPGPFA